MRLKLHFETKKVQCSVKDLAHFLYRSGGLGGAAFLLDRALEGSRIHRQLQKSRPETYTPEFALSGNVPVGDWTLKIKGRADGVQIPYQDGVLLEEIKTVWKQRLEEPRPEDLAQVKLYAALLNQVQPFETFYIKLTYYDLESETSHSLCSQYDSAQIKDFLDTTMERFLAWLTPYLDHLDQRNDALESLTFPLPFRKGQRDMAAQAFWTVKKNSTLYMMAPTGMGKTLGILFASLKGLVEKKGDRIIYLTAKNTGKLEVEKACRLLEEASFRSLTLTAKEKVCLQPELFCDTRQCPFALEFYDHLDDAIRNVLKKPVVTASVLMEEGERCNVCPYYLSLELISWMDVVIADYSYLFDPQIHKSISQGDNLKGSILLIDEAHNLPERARSMYSAVISKKQILAFRRQLRSESPSLYRLLGKMNAQLLHQMKSMREVGTSRLASGSQIESWKPQVEACIQEMQKLLTLDSQKQKARPVDTPIVELYFLFLSLLQVMEFYDETYSTLWEVLEDDISMTLFCVHPGPRVMKMAQKALARIFFSATLHPLPYFRSILGGDSDQACRSFDSPFPASHLKLLIAPFLSTRLRDRTRTAATLIDTIHAVVQAKVGNYMVFFPSFDYLEQIWNLFEYPEAELLKQERTSSEKDRADFLDRFQRNPSKHHIGFCVLGGVFAEGVDLLGSRLHGVIIVGVGLPPRSLKSDQIQAFHQRLGQNGYQFAYQLPGWTRVLQAAGRVIRSEQDQGTILLAGDRFMHSDYTSLYPSFWNHADQCENPGQIFEKLKSFWS